MSVKRGEVIGKRVYDQEAKLIGDVVDLAFKLEEKEVLLVVRTPGGLTMEIPSDKVAAAKDIVLLKEKVELPAAATQPAVTPPVAPAAQPSTPRVSIPFLKKKEEKICPYCGKPAVWIPQYQRWYCYNCQMYVD
ncbi:MAG: PRC-barrel domain-containing protein [Thermofilaceae archaeon]